MRSDNNDTKMKSGVQSGTGCLFSDKKPRRRKILTRPAVIAAAIALCLLAACGKKETGGSEEIPAEQTAQTPQEAGSSGEGREAIPVPDHSILLFKEDSGFARLREDMESGDTPVECNVLYDEGGARQGVTVDDPEVIRELYTCLAAVTVGEKSDESAADCRHHITFRLRNDTYVGVGFEGESLLCWGQESYTVRGAAPLWAYVRMLQDEAMEKTAKKSDSTQTGSKENQKKADTGGQSGTVAASDGGKTADAVTDEKKEDKAADREGRESAAAASEEKQKDNEITPAQTGSEEEPEESGNENAVTPVIVPSEEEKAEMESRSADSSEENAVTSAQTGSEEEPEESGNENAVTPAQTGSEEKAETGKSSEGKTGNDPADTGNETEKSPEGTSANSLEPAETEAAAQKPSGGEDAVTSARQKAYTEIVRAYAAALAQDRDSFLEDYANGLYDPEGINDQDGDGFGVMEGGLYVENAAEGDTEENGFSDGNAAEGDAEKDAEKDALRKAAAAGFDERINYELVREYFMYPEENRIFYGLTDYNADGIRELVFAIGNDQFRQVWTAYTFDGKKAVELFRGPYGLGERTILFTLPDKTFMIRASGGAFSGGETFCRIAEDLSGLETIAEYEYDERANGNLDRIATENHPASSGDGGEEQWPATITDEEFQERFVEKASSPADGISFELVSADASVGD